MKTFKTKLDGVIKIKLDSFEDHRGYYIETYNEKLYSKFKVKFIQDDISVSKKRVLRGIHGDFKTWKLITCLYGEFYFVVVNNLKKSKQYKKWQSFKLTDKNKLQILVPPGFGNGHQILSKKAIFHYKQSTLYDRKSQFTINYNTDNYKWPLNRPILSKRDA
jgi:dTDP-4-dehydrorhamnose 3,5-epimerase|tara:strand:- start:1496 stop:1981 length:486 start_codon:yes stop_codon:yes gene_type:complete